MIAESESIGATCCFANLLGETSFLLIAKTVIAIALKNTLPVFMTAENLIDFIDCQKNNGTIFAKESWREGIRLEEGIGFIHSLSSRDWLALRSLNLEARGNFWVEFLIELLDIAHTEEARQMIIHIALTGTEDNFSEAMERIQDFRKDVSIYSWLKLKNRSSEILKSRSNS